MGTQVISHALNVQNIVDGNFLQAIFNFHKYEIQVLLRNMLA